MKFSTMRFADETYGRPFAKDPCVVKFGGIYWLYYSVLDSENKLKIGIAQSENLDDWRRVGELPLVGEIEKNGIGAPGAVVLSGKIHLFYQSYGNREKDAICLATSTDGVHFERHAQNPIFRPTGDWNCGRAIDADVLVHSDKLYLYVATRSPDYKIQFLTVATASLSSDFGPESWKQHGDGPILKPESPWEGECIEAPAVVGIWGACWMFYGGGYNCFPQQIGLARSTDCLEWYGVLSEPFMRNGGPESWNANESGHPFVYGEGNDIHLFFQGTNDMGHTWFLSRVQIEDDDWPNCIFEMH